MILGYVYGHDETISRFVAELIPTVRGRGFGNCKTIGIVEGGLLIAGLVYHNWDPGAGVIEMSGAALPGHFWLTRETIRHMYQYPFIGCSCQMVVQRTPAEDERLLYMLLRYDYTLHKIPRLFGYDKDGVICCLTREAWEANRFNKRLRHHEPQLIEAA